MQAYNIIDKHIHLLSQTIAKFNRSFVTAKSDDSHTNLSFDFLGKKIWGRWATMGEKTLALSLNLDFQRFELVDKDYQIIQNFETIGKTKITVEGEIADHLSKHYKVEGHDFLKDLHFEIPAYDFAMNIITKWNTHHIQTWMDYRNLAYQASGALLKHLNVDAEIRIWPHHFDTGIYVEVNSNIGVGFGWAMADSMINEGYYYFTAYGLNGHSIDYSKADKLTAGKWITGEHWNGAVLKMSNVSVDTLHAFLIQTTRWAIS